MIQIAIGRPGKEETAVCSLAAGYHNRKPQETRFIKDDCLLLFSFSFLILVLVWLRGFSIGGGDVFIVVAGHFFSVALQGLSSIDRGHDVPSLPYDATIRLPLLCDGR